MCIERSTRQWPNNLQASDNPNNNVVYVGLGWFITTNFGHEIIWHNGATDGGYNAFTAFNPTTERGIVILSSADLANARINNIMFNPDDKISNLINKMLS